ncbi:MAG: tetratricopeptide repeat protein [Hyphomonadaceae bacterium]
MRAAILALSLTAAIGAVQTAFAAAPAINEEAVADQAPAAALRLTSPPNAEPDRTYESTEAALLEADLDYLVREARRATARGETASIWPVVAFADNIEAGRFEQARSELLAAPGGLQGSVADLLEPFLLAAEGQTDLAVERMDRGADALPAPLPEVAQGMIFEAAGRLTEASAIYAVMIERLDLTPPPVGEPASMEEFQRALNATRTAHAVYRAAMLEHRRGRDEEARLLYGIVHEFAPHSVDVERNLQRLDAGEQPLEPPLDAKRATGRWLLFLAEYLTQSDSLASVMAQNDPVDGLQSSSGSAFLQLGLALEPMASDWRLFAAEQLLSAGGLNGAQRIIDQMPTDSVFAPDADIVRAMIQLRRNNDDQAVAAAQRAVANGGARWAVLASAADVYRQARREQEALGALTQALSMVDDPEDQADVLGYRAFANRYFGRLAEASADMRRAVELDPSLDSRLLYVSILMDDPQAWQDGVRMARTLFAEQPDSVLRLNSLGYALIQRPEGLEEGYRLLWRGFNNGQTDYAVVDSLGWAYYLYGHFEQARVLIERSVDLTTEPNPEILDHLGDVYWRLDRRDDARAQWRLALDARPDAVRLRDLEQKLARGMTTPAPRERRLPTVNLPAGPAEREEL